jgi:hypothetical protein
MDLRERLQSTLGSAYVIDRELGGGGMSRVFVAHDTLARAAHRRQAAASGARRRRQRRAIQARSSSRRSCNIRTSCLLSAGELDG